MGILRSCFGVSNSEHKDSYGKQPSTQIEELCHRFSLAQIQKSTNNFDQSQLVGQGGFGKAYRGCLFINGEAKEIAVKRLPEYSLQGSSEFKNEILLLCQLRHPNLICLLGFCNDKNEMILVYEYMPNGSLSDQLHRSERSPVLSWKKRLEICIGVAHGIHYLHTGVKHTIFHRDVKLSNILLDKNWVPKLADFGLSFKGPVFSSKPKPIEVDRICGTRGYMAPEYSLRGTLTDKADVFSFGVVLVELICGKKPWTISDMMNESRPFDSLGQVVRKLVEQGNAEGIIDPFIVGKIAPECWKIYMDIAERCLDEEANERPTIGEVEVELERALELQEEADANHKFNGPHGTYSLLCTK